ncbi:hypothetical protein BU17DRAFT_104011 [Hysterangium stoloniferum]|nr:hypothetical protein BU17DRAFT_104011 [Hysterangium stoloniferum]
MDVVENDDDGDWVTDVGDKPDEIYRELEDSIRDMESNHVHYIKTSDIRDRHDRLECQNAAWALILPLLVDAHLQWEHTGPPKVIPEVEVHKSQDVMFPLDDQTPNVTMARHGYFGNAPHHPSIAISTSTLELLRVLMA